MRVAIIGCGFVGSAIARHWRHIKPDYVVTATTTSPKRVSDLEAIAQQVVVLKGNDAAALPSVLANQDAVLLSVGAANSSVYEEAYLETAKTLVSALKQAPHVKQVIYTGTYSVYGDRQGEWVDEKTPELAINPNGKILIETEQVLLAASNPHRKVCILRLGGIYGPQRELIKIFGSWAGTTRPGAGEDFTNWVHLEDIVGAVSFALEQELQGIYNLVGDVPLPRRELLDRLLERHELPPIVWDTTAIRQRSYNARVSNQKLKAAGYKFIHPVVVI